MSHCGFLRRVVLCAVMSFHVMSFDDVVFCLCLLYMLNSFCLLLSKASEWHQDKPGAEEQKQCFNSSTLPYYSLLLSTLPFSSTLIYAYLLFSTLIYSCSLRRFPATRNIRQVHQILLLPRKMTPMMDPCLT